MYYYIVNPAAGGGRINKIQTKLQSLLKQKRIDGEFTKSIGKGDASKIAKLAIKQGFTTIVAVGGDSTITEVANGIIGAPGVVLGILPIGSTNILSKELGINNWMEGVDVLAQRRVKTIGVGKLDGSFFLTSVEVGFETEILKERKELSFFNKFLFQKTAIGKILKFKPFKATIKFDNKFSVTSDIFNLSILNPKFLNEKKSSFSSYRKLNAVLIPRIHKIDMIRNAGKIIKASYDHLPFISKFQAEKILIETEGKPQNVFADAEDIRTTPIEVSISSKKIKVIVSKDK